LQKGKERRAGIARNEEGEEKTLDIEDHSDGDGEDEAARSEGEDVYTDQVMLTLFISYTTSHLRTLWAGPKGCSNIEL
jgi:hypothetical protein